MSARAAVVTAFASLALIGSGCGDEAEPDPDPGPSGIATVEGSLTFTRGDGTKFEVSGGEVRCGPSSTATKRPAIYVRTSDPSESKPFFQLEAIVADVIEDPVLEMPSNYIESQPKGGILFAFDPKTGNELDSTFEDSSGSITFERVSCDLEPQIEFSVDGVLDSEFGDLDPAAVEGSFTTAED